MSEVLAQLEKKGGKSEPYTIFADLFFGSNNGYSQGREFEFFRTTLNEESVIDFSAASAASNIYSQNRIYVNGTLAFSSLYQNYTPTFSATYPQGTEVKVAIYNNNLSGGMVYPTLTITPKA